MRMENDGHWSDPVINGSRKNQRTWNMYKNSAQTAKRLTLFFPQVKDSRIMMSIPLVAAILQLQTFMMVKQREGKPMASGGFHDSNIWVSLKMRHTPQRAIETMILMMNQITNAFKRPTHVNPHVLTNFTSANAEKATFCLKSSTMESCDFLSTSASIAWITSSA